MLNEITKISLDDVKQAATAGESITIIINGEYYALDASEDPFINGVKFAAAVIEDDRARGNCVFNGLRTIKRISKAATEANRIRNEETRHTASLLRYLIQTNPAPRYNEYINGKLWKLSEND